MPTRSSRLVACATGAQLALVVGVAPASAAPAASGPTIASAKAPKVVVLPASTRASQTTSFAIVFKVAAPDGVDTVVAGLYAPGKAKGTAVRATRTGGTAKSGTWTARVRLGATQPVGTWKVQAFATDRESRTSDPTKVVAEYDVRTPTRFSDFGIGEPVRPGSQVKVEGKLQRWAGKKGWVPYADRDVDLEFRPKGKKSFETVESLKTADDGTLGETTATADSAGAWRLSFAGYDTKAATVSREDEVKPTVPAPPPAEDEKSEGRGEKKSQDSGEAEDKADEKSDDAAADGKGDEKSDDAAADRKGGRGDEKSDDNRTTADTANDDAKATPSPTPTESPSSEKSEPVQAARPTGKPDATDSARARPRQPVPTSSPSSDGTRSSPARR